MNDRLVTALPDLSLFAGLVLVLLANRFAPWPQLGGLGIWFVGVMLVLSSLLVGMTVLLGLRRRRTSTSAGETPSVLVTSGAYRFSRNPYYLASAGLLLGVAALTGSLLALLVPAGYAFVINRFVIPVEERKLLQQFGADYEQYRGSVGRWL